MVNHRPPTHSVHKSILTEPPLSIHICRYMCVLPCRRRDAFEANCHLRTLASLLSTLEQYARATVTQSDLSWPKCRLRYGQRSESIHATHGTLKGQGRGKTRRGGSNGATAPPCLYSVNTLGHGLVAIFAAIFLVLMKRFLTLDSASAL